MAQRTAAHLSYKKHVGHGRTQPIRSRNLTPVDGQFIVQAQACGLTHKAAVELWACHVGYAMAVKLEPDKADQIHAAAARHLENVVRAANSRRAA